ncbi:cyclic nucleotide-gated cation channel beta-1 isoform X2 [Pieris napi]|uniref:cyclic nucleotide-gated cation channel beta-1 isoform X2 n=1 Tax=Pieris napi TaxID=78633 RepID=UPI001FBA069A|nr:cyclic nucleotide-gated cation channel beta-1 isoform X2 [Pieris napi]
MEVKVEVHTVYPSSLKKESSRPITKVSHGSWGTPDSTPKHSALLNNSSIEKKSIIKEEAAEKNKLSIFVVEKRVRLSEVEKNSDVKENATELKIFDQLRSSQKRGFEINDEIESPQSPVPSSPSKAKCKIFGFPTLFYPYMPIDPQGRIYITWLFLVTFCYSYNAWAIVLRATFPYQTPNNLPIWLTADYICDIFYILDVVLVKPRLIFLHDGFWVTDEVETRKHYKKKTQYKFDVISLLPLDILYVFFGTKMVILRFPRLLKLQTFWEFHQAMDRVLSSPYVVRIGKTLFYIFYLIHLNACAYYAISDYIGLGSNSWVYDNEGNAYIRCFYFATKTATSIGKNPKPGNTWEYLFMTAAWLMGVFVFAVLIGQIRDIIATATRQKTEYRKKVDGCVRYLRRLNMPASLQRRVTCWFKYTWKTQRCFDEARILNSLPYNMKRDVALEVHISTLSKVQLFRDCSASLLRDLVLQLRPVSFLPGDVVVRKGDVGHQMYIIKTGKCVVMSPDEKEVLATLSEGSVFGEISLLGIDGLRRRTATVRSRGYSTLFALSRNDLDTALSYHKEAEQILRRRADQIIRENAARQTKQQIAIDAKREDSDLRKRRKSGGSSESVKSRRMRSASALSKRKLSMVSEDKPQHADVRSASPDIREMKISTPIPTIIFSNEMN